MTKKHPHADSRLAVFLDRQIMAVRPKKQNEIAIEGLCCTNPVGGGFIS